MNDTCKAHDHPESEGGEWKFYNKPHLLLWGVYDGQPRPYCAHCGAWLGPPQKS